MIRSRAELAFRREENLAVERLERERAGRPLSRWVGRRRPHVTSTAHAQAIWLPVAQANLGSRGAFVGRTGTSAFVYDGWILYDEDVLDDPNMLITGSKGKGKSALCKTLAARLYGFGRRVEVIVGGQVGERRPEYEMLMEVLDGVHLTLGGTGVCLNPLERFLGERASSDAAVRAFTTRSGLLTAVAEVLLHRPLESWEEVGLHTALRAQELAHPDRAVTMQDIVTELATPSEMVCRELGRTSDEAADELRDCRLRIRTLTTGPMGGMFDEQTTVPSSAWESRAIAVDLSQISRIVHGTQQDAATAIGVMCVNAFLDGHRHRLVAAGDNTKTVRITDEAWHALGVAGAAKYYVASMKVSRKAGVAYWIALHDQEDLAASGDTGSRQQRLAMNVAAECATKVVYRPHSKHVAAIAETHMLNSREEMIIRGLAKAWALWIVGDRRFVVHHLRADIEKQFSNTDSGMSLTMEGVAA